MTTLSLGPLSVERCFCKNEPKVIHYAPHYDKSWTEEKKFGFTMGLFADRTGLAIRAQKRLDSGSYEVTVEGWAWVCSDVQILRTTIDAVASGIMLERHRAANLARRPG